jgi:hypothetical protein
MRCMLLIDTNQAARPAWGPPKGTPRPRGTTCSTARSPSAASCGAGSRSCGPRRPTASASGTAERRSPMAPRWHCCIWAEGVSDEYQSGGCSRGEGPRKGSKLPIVDVIWGVQASKWRTPRVLIVRCNSASKENSDFGRHGESYIVRTPTSGAGASEPARLSRSSTSSSPCSASAPSGDEPSRSRPGGAGRRPRGGGGAPPRKSRTRCSRCRPGLAPRRRPGRAAGHGAMSDAACWGTGGARSGS